MILIDTDTSVAVRPVPAAVGTPGWFTGGNPGPGTPVAATQFSADWANHQQGELKSILDAMGIAPDKTKFDQVLTAIKGLIQLGAGTYYPDTGAANAYVITPAPAILAYAAGQRFLVVPTNVNTGASTINVNALGVKSIVKPDGSNLVAGDIPASGLVEIVYQAALGKFVLLTTINTANSAATPGYLRIPGSKFIIQWARYSITPSSSTNTPPSTKWGVQTISWPLAFPNALLAAVPGPQVTNNGQFVPVGLGAPATSGIDVYATCWDDVSVGLPLVGWVLTIGY